MFILITRMYIIVLTYVKEINLYVHTDMCMCVRKLENKTKIFVCFVTYSHV